ncbi:MAG: hypothetical protein PVSMB7_23370 [Chloroflexota bacterium]
MDNTKTTTSPHYPVCIRCQQTIWAGDVLAPNHAAHLDCHDPAILKPGRRGILPSGEFTVDGTVLGRGER